MHSGRTDPIIPSILLGAPDGQKFRTEKDTLGEFPVPADAWYGIQTARAVDNFPISGRGPDRDFTIAQVRIKRAAAVANREGWLARRETGGRHP